jgi:hypothetical protein
VSGDDIGQIVAADMRLGNVRMTPETQRLARAAVLRMTGAEWHAEMCAALFGDDTEGTEG